MAAAATKTEQRRQTIKRGTKRGASLGEKALTRAALAEIGYTAEPNPGADTGEEIQRRAEQRRSMAAENYRAPDASSADELRSSERDPRYVPLSFLLSDLRRRVKLHTRGFSRDERGDIATDAALLLMRWTSQGATAPIYLGQRGELPLRREWLDTELRTVIRDGASTRPAPNAKAERAMRAAILQVVRTRNSDTEHALALAVEQLDSSPLETSELSLAAEALKRQQQSAELAPSLPDTDAAELLAGAMGISLTAARALIARGYRLATDSPTDNQAAQLAALWDVTAQRARDIMSRGAAEIRKRYPEPAELLDALAAAAPELREQLATRAYQALASLAMAPRWDTAHQLDRAERAVSEWRAAIGELPLERRAIELAAQRVGWMPTSISASEHLRRLMRAEQSRARGTARAAQSGSHLNGASSGASSAALARFTRKPSRNSAAAPRNSAAPLTWSRFGDGYSGASSVLYLYRRGARRPELAR